MTPARIALTLVVVLMAAVATAAAIGAHRWTMGTRELRARLDAARMPVSPRTVDFGELEGLPPPVQAYFRGVLAEGQPMVSGVHMRHKGTFNMGDGADQWKQFTSDQKVVTQRPGFDWDARIALMPAVSVRVHDAYVAGEGLLQASLLGIVQLASMRGNDDMAEGQLMRYLAEAPWYPTGLLPSQGVHWEPVDDRSARATLTDGNVTATLLFRFAEVGTIESVRADARGRTVKGEIIPTPWEGRFWSYDRRDGMLVPLEGEVSWLLPAGPAPYWRGSIADITYLLAE